MTIYRRSKGNYEEHEEVEIFTHKYTSNVGGKASFTCDGQIYYGTPDEAPVADVVDDTPEFISGSWSKDYEGKIRVATDTADEKGYRAQLEDFVYFQLKVNKSIPVGTVISFDLYDKNTLLGMDCLAFDDKMTNEDNGKDIPVTGTGIVKEYPNEEYNKITLKVYLNPTWNTQLQDDKGSFKDGCLDLYFNWTYRNQLYTVDKDTLILSVYYNRDLFISEAYPSKYKFPEIIDSSTGESLIFILNEGSDAAGMIDSKIEKIYMIRVRTLSQYKFEGGTNSITKKMFEERYNLRTGESSTKNIFEVTESVEFKIKDSKTITNLESTVEKEVKKNFSDYYNIYDISNLGIRIGQEVLNIFGYLDLFGDLQAAIAGRGLSTYDTIGLGTTAADMATKVAMNQATKVATKIATAEGTTITPATTKQIASMALPEWITPATCIMICVEETISKPFVTQVMQEIEETMFWRMEYAKRGGLKKVRLMAQEQNMSNYFQLIEGISQQKHNQVFLGKIRTYAEFRKFDQNSKPNSKTYSYLLRKIEINESEGFNYSIETIFI